MLGIVFIYFIGKSFYKLAEQYEKQKWVFAILGVLSFYLGTFILGIGFGILDEFGLMSIENIDNTLLGIMSMPGGALICWGTYKLLENKWKKDNTRVLNPDILDNDVDLA